MDGSALISLDGYVAGPLPERGEPARIGGEKLHAGDAAEGLQVVHGGGSEGGEDNPSDDVLRERFAGVGASIMGRRVFRPVPGRGARVLGEAGGAMNRRSTPPSLLLTHYEREPLEVTGTTFYFVTEAIEAALEQATEAAAGHDVAIVGGASSRASTSRRRTSR